MPKRNREDIGKPDNDQRTVKTKTVNNRTPDKVDVVKSSNLQSDSDGEIPNQKENANPANSSVVNSTNNLKPIEDKKSATPQSSQKNDIGTSGGAQNVGKNNDTKQNSKEEQKPFAEVNDNPRRASNDPREVKKMQRQKELGIND